MRRVYLDHNATTPLDPRVLEAMLPALRQEHGNPSSIHGFGQRARAIVEDARAEVAALVAAQPTDVVFTGSGTEADNLAVRGVALAAREGRRKIVYAAFEHHAVVNTARALGREGFPVEAVKALPGGQVDLDDLAARVDDRTALVCLMLANNETGVVQPLAEAVAVARRHGALVHCDAVQAAGKLPVDFAGLGADLLALSAHKIYGPKGVGALVVRRGTKLEPLLRGGAQERNAGPGPRTWPASPASARPRAWPSPGWAPTRPGWRRCATTSRPGCWRSRTRRSTAAPRAWPTPPTSPSPGPTPRACSWPWTWRAWPCRPGRLRRRRGGALPRAARDGLPMARVQASLRFSLGRDTTAEEVALAASLVARAVDRQRAAALARR